MSFNGVTYRAGLALARGLHKHVDDVIRPMLTGGEILDFDIEASSGTFQTARWIYDDTRKQHHITVSSRALLANEKGASKPNFLRSLANHEACHALFSERDQAELERISMGARPLLEMLEDARIESAWRRATKKKFNWYASQYLQTVDKSNFLPSAILADLITAECRKPIITEIARACAGAGYGATFEKVKEFYRRAYDPKITPSTKELEPVIKDWLKEFGVASGAAGGAGGGMHGRGASGGGAGMGGGSAAGGGMSAPGGGSGMSGGSAAGGGMSAPGGGIGGGGGGIAGGEMDVKGFSKEENKALTNGHFEKGGGGWGKSKHNQHEAEVCEMTLREAFRVGEETRFTVAPAPRIDMRHLIGGLPNIFRGSLHTGDDSPMNVRLIIDTSGSMTTPWNKVLGGVVQGMLRLHEAGQMKIDLWLTGNSRFSHIAEPKESHANLIYTGGGNEYISATLRASNKFKAHTDYDAVLVITDGQITDGSVTRDDLSGQDNCIAIYSTGGVHVPKPIIDRMREQFPCAIARDSRSSLCEAIVSELVAMRQARLHNDGVAV